MVASDIKALSRQVSKTFSIVSIIGIWPFLSGIISFSEKLEMSIKIPISGVFSRGITILSILFLAIFQKLLGMSSKDSILSGKWEVNTFKSLIAFEILSASTNKVVIILGNWKSFNVAAVIIPSVPSAPIKRFFKS